MLLRKHCGVDESAMTIDQAQRYCADVTKQSGSNFVHSFVFLSSDRREAMYTVYAFCREVDTIVDHPMPNVDVHAALDAWREQLASMYTGTPRFPVAIGLSRHVKSYDIPFEYFDEVINGVEMDLTVKRYATFTDLYHYCYRVASVVGLICIKVFGTQSPRSEEYAVNLGVAFQLTNILRDVGRDAQQDRLYLPQEDLIRFGCPERDVFANKNTAAFRQLMAFQVHRAYEYYARAQTALPSRDRRALLVAEMMRGVYLQLLCRIARDPSRVFRERVCVPSSIKAVIAIKTWLKIMLQLAVAKALPTYSWRGK